MTEPPESDVEKTGGGQPPTLSLDEAGEARTAPLDTRTRRRIAQRQDWVRTGLAVALLVLLSVVVLAPLTETHNWADAKDYLTIVLPAVTGLIGSAIGYYFGSRS